MVTQKPQYLIAVVDDDPGLREAIKSLLNSAGIRAESFSTAEEFLGSKRAHKTACLIADVRLPGMSGLELQHSLLQMGRRMPIVFITANEDAQGRMRAQALDAGAVAFLRKPFGDGDLMHAIESALQQRM